MPVPDNQYFFIDPTATTNAYLGGDTSVIWPALIASLACFALNVGLLYYLYAMEKP